MIDRNSEVAKQTSANPCAIVYPRLSVDNDVDTEFYTAAYCYSLYQLAALQKKQPDKFWFDDGLLQLMDRKRAGQILDKYTFNDDFVSQLNSFYC